VNGPFFCVSFSLFCTASGPRFFITYFPSTHTLTFRVSADSSALTTGGWFMAERCECILIRFNAPLRCDTHTHILVYKLPPHISELALCDDQLGHFSFRFMGKTFSEMHHNARRTITSWVTSEIYKITLGQSGTFLYFALLHPRVVAAFILQGSICEFSSSCGFCILRAAQSSTWISRKISLSTQHFF